MGIPILNTSFAVISKHRTALMGLSILYVFLFHCIGKWAPAWLYDFSQKGDTGVDAFIFLSAIGLSYSFSQNAGLLNFYRRRFIRIFPTYWIVLALVYISVFCLIHILHAPDDYWPHPHNFIDILSSFSTVGFWIPGCLWYDWYIPSLILLYVIFPFFYIIIEHNKCWGLLCLIPSLYITYSSSTFPWYYSCLIYRLGGFIYGILFFWLINRPFNKRLSVVFLIIGFVSLFLAGFTDLLNFSNEFCEESISYVLLPLKLYALCYLLEVSALNKLFSFFGGLSLEVYLLHQPLLRMAYTVQNYIPKFNSILIVVTTLLMSVIISMIIKSFMKR